MMNERKKLILPILLLIVVMIGSTAASFAYFTAMNTEHEFSDLQLTAAEMGVAYGQSGSEINLLVKGEYMNQSVVNADIPAATSINDNSFIITLETFDSGGTLKCTYDIVYEPTVPFYNSVENLTNAYEYTIKGNANINGDFIPETNIGNVTSELTLIEDVQIELSGVNKKKSQEWTFTAAFYNQTFNQDDNQGITFGGKIVLKNLECVNEFINS